MQTAHLQHSTKSINELLHQKRLKEALDALNAMVRETQNSALIDTLYNLEMTYKNLLHYTIEGFSDPERQKIYNHLVADLFRVSDQIFRERKLKTEQGRFAELLRKHQHSDLAVLDKQIGICQQTLDRSRLMEDGLPGGDFDEALGQLFEILMTQGAIYQHQQELQTLFSENTLPWPQQCQLVSAISIHLLQFFNEGALLLLFQLSQHKHLELRQRALTGLLLVLFHHDQRLPYFPEVLRQTQKLGERFAGKESLQNIVIQLIRTRETEKLARKLSDEILPEVARIHPNLRDRLDLENIIGDSFKEGKNPDWEDIFSDSPELMGKLEEFSRLQMEGADLFLSTFRMLKHFPFFNQLENWFLPFPWPNPIAENILKNESGLFKNPDLLQGIAQSGIICNSDKYSLLLSIPQMPSAQKEMMGQMFMAELSALSEVEKSDQLVDAHKKELAISNQYIQDLYRFYKVYPARNGFNDPFAGKMDFHNSAVIHHLFPGSHFLQKLSAYLFEKDRYQEALEVFALRLKQEEPDRQLLQKQGYCMQQLGNYEGALHCYLQADLFDHEQVWNLKKIALCYRYLKQPEKALEYYQKAEKVQPDNLHTQVSIGHCLLELKDYEQALKYYFKVEYLDPGNQKVWRPIVWCALALGKFEQAEKYARQLIDKKPTQHDYLNMGHLFWCMGKRQDALQWYQKCVTFPGQSMQAFLESFNNDKEMLLKHGVDEMDIPIMLDQLRYHLE